MKIIPAEEFKFEIKEIQEFPKHPIDIKSAVSKRMKQVSKFPESAPICVFDDGITRKFEWRMLVVCKYLVFYYIDGNVIRLCHIIDSARDYRRILESRAVRQFTVYAHRISTLHRQFQV